MATFAFASGVLARIWLTFELPEPGLGSQVEFTIVGSEGMLELDSYAAVRLGTKDGWRVLAEQPQGNPDDPFDPMRLQSYADQLRDFVDAVAARQGAGGGRAGRTDDDRDAGGGHSLRSGAQDGRDRCGPEGRRSDAPGVSGVTARAYAAAVLPRLEQIVRSQLPAIERAGATLAESLAGGGRVWVAQTSHYLHHEATHRAGGFLAVHLLESPDRSPPGRQRPDRDHRGGGRRDRRPRVGPPGPGCGRGRDHPAGVRTPRGPAGIARNRAAAERRGRRAHRHRRALRRWRARARAAPGPRSTSCRAPASRACSFSG